MPSIVFYSLCLFLSLDAVLLWLISTRGREITAKNLCWALLSVVGVAVVRAPFLGSLGFSGFGVISLLYYDLVLVMPSVSLLLLLSLWVGRLRTSTRVRAFLWSIALLLPAIGVYASLIETRRLQFEQVQVKISKERSGSQPIKIAHFSDIQTYKITEYETNAAARIMAERPDLIVISGDLFQGTNEQFASSLEGFRQFLRGLSAPGGVYFVEGDAERDHRTKQLLEGTGVQYLYNEVKEISIRDRQISLLGLELRYSSRAAQSALTELSNPDTKEDLRLLLSHRPDSALLLPEGSRVDLVLAGHTHGGQVKLPFFGPLITLSDVPREVAGGGLFQINGNQIYVSRGLGYEGGQAPPLRFLCPPEIALITLE